MSPDKAQPESEGILQKLSGVSKKVALPALGAAALSIQEVRDALIPNAYAALPAPTFDSGTTVTGASNPGIHEAWPAPVDPDPTNGTSSDVKLIFTESDESYYTPMHLAPGATTASEVSVTGMTDLWGCQAIDSTNMVCLELDGTSQQLSDTSSGEDWSSGSMALDAYFTASQGEIAYDQITGDRGITTSSGGDYGVEFTDGTIIADSATADENVPILDVSRDRAFYMKNMSEMWMVELSTGTTQRVTSLDDCFYAGFDHNNLDWYCSVWNGTDFDIEKRHETTYDTATPVDADSDGYTEDEDCDDAVAAVNPGAEEVCDGVDNNCDSVVDTDATDKATWYQDYDGDGLGNPAVSEEACDQPEGYVANNSDTDDSGEVSCIDDSVAGPYDEGDVICLGTGGTSVVGSGDVVYDGYSSVRLDELLDAADLEGLGVLDASDFGWRFEAVDSDSVGGLVMGVSGFTEGEEVGSFTVYAGQFNAINTVTEESTPIGPGTYTVEYNEEPTDRDGDGVEDSLDLFPDDKSEWADADGDGLGDNGDEDDDNDGFTDEVEMAAGTNPLDANSYPIEDTGDDTGSGTVDSGEDTDEPVEEKPTKKKPEQTGCATASTPVGQPSRAPWHAAVVSAFAAGIAMLRRRKAA